VSVRFTFKEKKKIDKKLKLKLGTATSIKTYHNIKDTYNNNNTNNDNVFIN
jgi:hypothetical protein